MEVAYHKAQGSSRKNISGGKGGTEPASYELSAEVLERSSDGDDNRRVSPILPGVLSLWCGVAGPAPAQGKGNRAGRQSAGSLRAGQEDVQ